MRNIAIFYVGTLLLSTIGGFFMAAGEDVGGLIFITSPFLMVLVARFFLGDGWGDAGLKVNLYRNWGWYLFATFGYFLIFPVVIGINTGLGFTTLTTGLSEGIPILLSGFAIQFIPRMLFSLSEEWAWRGYLEPKLTALGYSDLPRLFIISVLWGVWHFPLILGSDYTETQIVLFLIFFMIGIVPTAFVWGQMRSRTGSVWPVVIMHGVANALGFAILEGNLIEFNVDLLGSIAAGNLVLTLVWFGIAAWVWRQPIPSQNTIVAHPSN